MRIFKSAFVLSFALAAVAAQADVNVNIAGREYRLPYCNGTVLVNTGGNGNQINVVINAGQCNELSAMSSDVWGNQNGRDF